MEFIGREPQLQTLERQYRRDSGFVVIYGRRRVGKTTLIKEFIKDKKALYFLATKQLENGNIKNFSRVLAEFTGQDYLQDANFSDWEAAFRAFASFAPEQKKVLVIDEFQDLAEINPAFSSIFQRVWDEVLQNKQIMVIICGSLISMMLTQALSHQSPLYGRRTAQIRLGPLKFTELWEHNQGKKTFEQMVETYAVTGGVPKYYEFFANDLPLFENIEQEILKKDGFLYEEPVFLLEKEVREPISYFSIIKCIATGNHKLSQIAANLEMPANRLSPYLKTLIDLNLVEKRVPVTESQPEKSRKGLYYICDHFIEFWFKFVYNYQGELELDNTGYILRKLKRNFIDNHVAHVYEDVCRDLLLQLSQTGAIDFTVSKIGSYWGPHVEFDLVALDEERRQAILGECKYRLQPVDVDVLCALEEKAANIPELQTYSQRYLLFSKSGYTERLLKIAAGRDQVVLVNRTEIMRS
ncbi:MAG: ATP-binding protein [Bacillota bacterium]|jgi:AAA+ ATPase superfamily predicted ATPase